MLKAAFNARSRRAEFETSWERTLTYLVVDNLVFREAFSAKADLLGRL